MNDIIGDTALGHDMEMRPSGLVAPSRRTLLLGAGVLTLGAGFAANAAPASAAPVLRKGSRGSAVLKLQKDLIRLKYWLGTPDGSFGHLTQQAVYAIQKAAGLGRDGVVGTKTYAAIARGVQPKRRITSGTGIEVSKSSQLLIATSEGKLSYILNTSTGSGERYYSGGRWKRATTPTGDFRMFRLHSRGWQSGPLGDMYRPGYYDRGWAIHGSRSIPAYPASHGCSRISTAASDMLWSRSWFISGRRVLIY
ncbi:L,D-transpeptidase family protein [Brachybacterium muris]|uniref:L,D-transpeptidase family protein n=1 Tax=Brachybacterium muris TaxID=219301 RepID=UPI00223AEC56|nr:L,D-transpeptidase family protein [Brachybacterium muris]MCT2295932.1 L,D-transpeptidase family protein [Brachybacterium muris]